MSVTLRSALDWQDLIDLEDLANTKGITGTKYRFFRHFHHIASASSPPSTELTALAFAEIGDIAINTTDDSAWRLTAQPNSTSGNWTSDSRLHVSQLRPASPTAGEWYYCWGDGYAWTGETGETISVGYLWQYRGGAWVHGSPSPSTDITGTGVRAELTRLRTNALADANTAGYTTDFSGPWCKRSSSLASAEAANLVVAGSHLLFLAPAGETVDVSMAPPLTHQSFTPAYHDSSYWSGFILSADQGGDLTAVLRARWISTTPVTPTWYYEDPHGVVASTAESSGFIAPHYYYDLEITVSVASTASTTVKIRAGADAAFGQMDNLGRLDYITAARWARSQSVSAEDALANDEVQAAHLDIDPDGAVAYDLNDGTTVIATSDLEFSSGDPTGNVITRKTTEPPDVWTFCGKVPPLILHSAAYIHSHPQAIWPHPCRLSSATPLDPADYTDERDWSGSQIMDVRVIRTPTDDGTGAGEYDTSAALAVAVGWHTGGTFTTWQTITIPIGAVSARYTPSTPLPILELTSLGYSASETVDVQALAVDAQSSGTGYTQALQSADTYLDFFTFISVLIVRAGPMTWIYNDLEELLNLFP